MTYLKRIAYDEAAYVEEADSLLIKPERLDAGFSVLAWLADCDDDLLMLTGALPSELRN